MSIVRDHLNREYGERSPLDFKAKHGNQSNEDFQRYQRGRSFFAAARVMASAYSIFPEIWEDHRNEVRAEFVKSWIVP